MLYCVAAQSGSPLTPPRAARKQGKDFVVVSAEDCGLLQATLVFEGDMQEEYQVNARP